VHSSSPFPPSLVSPFTRARDKAPAIIFIDELDSIGRARGQTALGGSSETDQTLNQILTEMDGFSSKEGVIVLAATNQPDVLDKALLRPGRFDRRITVPAPDVRGRHKILEIHTRRVPPATHVDPEPPPQTHLGLPGAHPRRPRNPPSPRRAAARIARVATRVRGSVTSTAGTARPGDRA